MVFIKKGFSWILSSGISREVHKKKETQKLRCGLLKAQSEYIFYSHKQGSSRFEVSMAERLLKEFKEITGWF